MTLIEGSFGQAAQNHHFKRARWRRLWRQSIQDHLIAAVQNVKKMITEERTSSGSASENLGRTPESGPNAIICTLLALGRIISQKILGHCLPCATDCPA
jgi:hypothetical protein